MNSNESAEHSERQGRDDREMRRSRWQHKRKKLLMVPAIIAIGLIKAGAILFLWNELVPELFHGPTVTYLQAVELLILAKLLIGFGGMRGGHHHRHGHGHKHGFGHHRGHFFKKSWMNLTLEEREKMREDLRKKWDR